MVLVVLGLSRWGQAQERFELSTHQIVQALADRGIQVSDSQVTLVAKVVATDPSPKLDLLSVAPFGSRLHTERAERRTWIRMACHRPGACLPFYAIVMGTEGQAANVPIASTANTLNQSLLFEPKSEITMQAGTHATLILDDHRSRIRVSVISLEKGFAGSRIRVSSPDHKQVYVAEIVSSNQLIGSF